MKSYAITTPAIEYDMDAFEQFEQLFGGLMAEKAQGMTHREAETPAQTEGGELLRRIDPGAFRPEKCGGADSGACGRGGWLREATRKAADQQGHKQQTRLSPGEKKQRKRMATVVSVYEIDRYLRTPEPILDPEQKPEGKRPRPSRERT